MSDLGILRSSAVLIRNGLIVEAGPARRIENLAGARKAGEIDAGGRIVMPAFADVDVELVSPPPKAGAGLAIRVLSERNVTVRAAIVAGERARYGCLTVGATTSCATDIRNVIKVLRAHRALQSKPLRIRSVYSHRSTTPIDELVARWLPAMRRERLTSVIDLNISEQLDLLREAAICAAAAGFAVRLRSESPPVAAALELALSAGAIAIVAPMDSLSAYRNPLAGIGCLRVVSASDAFNDSSAAAPQIRNAIDDGGAIALSSGHRPSQNSSFNMQFLLHLAVERLGMTAEEAIIATTYNAVCSLRLSHATGSIEPGKSADLVMMEVSDYRDLARRAGHHDVNMVMRAGQLVSRRSPLNPD